MVVSELQSGSDIIPVDHRSHHQGPPRPRCGEVYVDDERRQATVVVPDGELSLAMGEGGPERATPAPALTGWRIDIVSETE